MAADGNWCTPPDSPSKARHEMISSSYEHAISDNDWYWDWHHDTREDDDCEEVTTGELTDKSNTQSLSTSLPTRSPPIPTPRREQVHEQPPPHLRLSDPVQHEKISMSQQDSGVSGMGVGVPRRIDDFPSVTGKSVLVAASDPTTVGFTPAYQPSGSYETTQIASLPGTRRAKSVGDSSVVLLPPKSKNKPPKSIEDVGHNLENYAPIDAAKLDKSQIGGKDYEVGCFNYLAPFGEAKLKSQEVNKISLTKDDLLSLDNTSGDTSSASIQDDYLNNPYAEFTQSCTCYDMMPDSIKMVVLDRRLPVKKAFFALVQNGVRAAPVWNSTSQEFVGMLTISDFVNILIFHYKSPIVEMDELEEQTIQMWRESERQVADLKPTLIRIDPMESLYKATQMLVENKIHRLPVIDYRTGDAVYIMTHKRLLHYICMHLMNGPQPDFMQKPLKELGIGTYSNIATATRDTPLIVALHVFAEKRISALPIVDETGRVVDIYAKYDVINLAAERTYNNLDIPLYKALQHRAEGFEGVHTCQLTDTFLVIVKRFVDTQVHRLVVVDNDKHVIGVLSLSDLLSFLVLNPHT